MSIYSDKLKDPRWQKKRLEILQRDNFTCRICHDERSQLNVHHIIYNKNKDPWDYDNNILITLCNDCHNYEHENADYSHIISEIFVFLTNKPLSSLENLFIKKEMLLKEGFTEKDAIIGSIKHFLNDIKWQELGL